MTNETDAEKVTYALKLMREAEPAALVAALMTLAECLVDIRDGTNDLPPPGMNARAVVDSVMRGTGARMCH